MSRRKYDGRLFHTRGPAAVKLLSPNVLWVRGTTQVLLTAGLRGDGHYQRQMWQTDGRTDWIAIAIAASDTLKTRQKGFHCGFVYFFLPRALYSLLSVCFSRCVVNWNMMCFRISTHSATALRSSTSGHLITTPTELSAVTPTDCIPSVWLLLVVQPAALHAYQHR